MFSSPFFAITVAVSLAWTALGAVTLVLLLVRDWKNHELW